MYQSTSNAMESNSDNTISTNQNKVLKMAMQNESGELGRLARPPVNGLDARGGSERDSGLSLPKMMVLVSGEAIQSVSDGAGEAWSWASNTAAKSSRAAALMSHEHLLTENEIAQLYELLRQLEA